MTTLLDRQREFTNYLVSGFPELGLRGIPLVSACAVTGNASVENLVKPVTIGVKDHGSDGSLQWRLDRLDGPFGLKGWSSARGLPWDTLKTQAAFFLWELHRDYSDFLEVDLRAGTKKIETLTANVCKIYERPNMALAHLDLRISHAKSVYKILSEERKPSLGTVVVASGTAIGGGVLANTNGVDDPSSWSALSLALVLAAIIWAMGGRKASIAPQRTLADYIPEEFGLIEPIEVSSSPAASLDAALAHAQALEIETAKAWATVADEREKINQRIEALRSAIAASNPRPAVPVKTTGEA